MVGGYGDCPWSSTGRRTADPSVKMIAMTNGKVVDGRVELDEPIADGTRVEVVPIEDEEFFDLDEQLEAELLESMAEGDRGETVAAEDVLKRLEEI